MAEFFVEHVDSGEHVRSMLLSPELVTVVSVWCHGVIIEEIDPFDPDKRQPGINVPCGDEIKRASLGDYVIRREDLSFDVVGPNEFKHTYRIREA